MKSASTAVLLVLGSFACRAQQTPPAAPPAVPPAAASAAAPAAAERPRLVILCAVDQLAAWVFDDGLPHLPEDGGFRRLLRGGTRLQNCAYEHACTETGPGHATIGTGVAARVHGIVRNKWWVRERGLGTYCVDEPMAALPDLPEGRNRGPGLLLAPTFAGALKAASPASRAVSVSWKDRSAILMAGPKADLAVWFEGSTGRFVTNTAWVASTPAWLAAFNATKPADAWFGSTWRRSGPDSAYVGLVDDRPYELPHGNGRGGRTLPAVLDGGIGEPGPEYYTQLYASPGGNTLVREAAEAAVRGMELGADATTDLLCVSFSSTDVVGHYFGPDSVEARDALLRLDQELARLLTFFDERVGAGRWALFLTADHGVGPTPEWARERGIDAGRGAIQSRVVAIAERAVAAGLGPAPAGRRYLAHVGEFSVFFDDATLDAVRGERTLGAVREQAADLVAAAIVKAPKVAAAFATHALLAPGGAPDPLRRSLVDALCPGRAGEVQIVLAPHWLDGATPASHGTPHAYDREVVGLAFGPGVPAGASIADAATPGFGAIWFAQMLGLPRVAGASDRVPPSFGAPW